jgi:hypothetical protein
MLTMSRMMKRLRGERGGFLQREAVAGDRLGSAEFSEGVDAFPSASRCGSWVRRGAGASRSVSFFVGAF